MDNTKNSGYSFIKLNWKFFNNMILVLFITTMTLGFTRKVMVFKNQASRSPLFETGSYVIVNERLMPILFIGLGIQLLANGNLFLHGEKYISEGKPMVERIIPLIVGTLLTTIGYIFHVYSNMRASNATDGGLELGWGYYLFLFIFVANLLFSLLVLRSYSLDRDTIIKSTPTRPKEIGISSPDRYLTDVEPVKQMIDELSQDEISVQPETIPQFQLNGFNSEIEFTEVSKMGFTVKKDQDLANSLGYLTKESYDLAQQRGLQSSINDIVKKWKTSIGNTVQIYLALKTNQYSEDIEQADLPSDFDELSSTVNQLITGLIDGFRELEGVETIQGEFVKLSGFRKKELFTEISQSEFRAFADSTKAKRKEINSSVQSKEIDLTGLKSSIDEKSTWFENRAKILVGIKQSRPGSEIEVTRIMDLYNLERPAVLRMLKSIAVTHPAEGSFYELELKYIVASGPSSSTDVEPALIKPIKNAVSTTLTPTASSQEASIVEFPDIFLSFSSNEKTLAEAVYEELTQIGYDSWISSKDIKIGQEYSIQILDAIDNSEYFILLVSEGSVKSRHVKTELERAFSNDSTIFPFLLTNLTIPRGWEYYLSTSQWFDLSKHEKNQFPKIISQEILKRIGQPETIIHTAKENDGSSKEKETTTCFFCQYFLEDLGVECPNCKQRCEICKRAIRTGEKWTTCSSQHPEACLKPFHENEYVEWVRNRERCPYCKQVVDANWYGANIDASEKIALFIAQNLKVDVNDDREFRSISLHASDTMLILSRIAQRVEGIQSQLNEMETTAFDRHHETVKIIQPMALSIEFIRETSERIELNMVTDDHMDQLLEDITPRLQSVMDNVDLILAHHEKNSGLRAKMKQSAISVIGDQTMDLAIKDTGIGDEILGYSDNPSGSKLRGILGKIRHGLTSKAGSPKQWLKLASIVLLL